MGDLPSDEVASTIPIYTKNIKTEEDVYRLALKAVLYITTHETLEWCSLQGKSKGFRLANPHVDDNDKFICLNLDNLVSTLALATDTCSDT